VKYDLFPSSKSKEVELSLCLTNEALCHEDVWESGYIHVDHVFLTLALVGGEWSAYSPAALSCPKSPWYLLYRSLDG
jgi:hypothetical protein